MPIRICIDCGDKKELVGEVRSKRCHLCANRLSNQSKISKIRKEHIKSRYRMITYKGKREYTHRVVMMEYLGRDLYPEEHVHHIDGNPKNNDISNLELLTAQEHHRYHMIEQNKKTQQHIKAANIRWGNN